MALSLALEHPGNLDCSSSTSINEEKQRTENSKTEQLYLSVRIINNNKGENWSFAAAEKTPLIKQE